MSSRIRTTRLSSGSATKRNYRDGMSSSEEDDEFGKSKKNRRIYESDSESDSEDEYEPEKKRKKGGKIALSDDDEDSEEEEYDDDESESESEEFDDESESEEEIPKKRKSGSSKSTPNKNQKISISNSSNSFTPAQETIIEIVRAPTEPSPKDSISKHTLNFMRDLQDPLKNDRDWFAARKDFYNYCHKNWLDFTASCVDAMIENVDDTIAWMQPKDLIERIYRDVRFSNDKTPYKRHLSWCMSRQGRKGDFAKYYLAISANNGSGLHAGHYESTKEDLQTFRQHIQENSLLGQALKELVQDKTFCKTFGNPPKGKERVSFRTSLWGSNDELKKAPKGVDPNDRDIQWLRLKSFTVSHKFKDEEVLSPNFIDKVLEVAIIARPLVEIINEMLHGPVPGAV